MKYTTKIRLVALASAFAFPFAGLGAGSVGLSESISLSGTEDAAGQVYHRQTTLIGAGGKQEQALAVPVLHSRRNLRAERLWD
jgi:hypothetical protein